LTAFPGCPQTPAMTSARSLSRSSVWIALALACGSAPTPEATAPATAGPEDLADDSAPDEGGSSPAFNAGVDAITKGDFETARGVFEKVVGEQPGNAKAHFYLGVAQQNLGQTDVAVASYEKALSLDPKLTEASVNLTAALLDAGEAARAEPVIERALARDPKHPGLLYNRALAASMLGNKTEAVRAYREALAADPTNLEIEYGYAEALVVAGSNSQAKELLAELTRSSDVAVLASSARLLGRLEDYEGCIRALDKAVGLQPSAELFVARGLCQHGKKDDASALKDFQSATRQDSSYAPAHYYLGMQLKAQGKKADARAELSKASKLGGDTGVGKAAQHALEGL
jgi:tetratricopeptide (TPR) repeat protein